METRRRKFEHIRICLEENVESSYTGFEDVMLIHKALPEVDYDKISLEIEFLGEKLKAPIIIAGMTGGHPETKKINENLALAAEEFKIGIGVGSQRAGIEDESLVDTYTVVRDNAPNAFLIANIGIAQVLEKGVEYAEKAVEMIDADALAVHLNFLQEAVQPEGDKKAEGAKEALKEVCSLNVPVIVKETGAGISREVAFELREAGAAAIDVGGKGGTSWSAVEAFRIKDDVMREVAIDFWDWGIPTAFCVAEVHDVLPTIATGGIRSGIDVAKSLALGAKAAGIALPFLKPATSGEEDVKRKVKYFIESLKTAMFLTGCKKVDDLRRVPLFITGKLKEWLEFREIDIEAFTRRR